MENGIVALREASTLSLFASFLSGLRLQLHGSKERRTQGDDECNTDRALVSRLRGLRAKQALKRRRADEGWARDKRTSVFFGICWELIPEIVIMAYGTYIIAFEIAN